MSVAIRADEPDRIRVVLEAWHRQLEIIARPLIERALQEGYGLQFIVFLHQDGKVGNAKFSGTT